MCDCLHQRIQPVHVLHSAINGGIVSIVHIGTTILRTSRCLYMQTASTTEKSLNSIVVWLDLAYNLYIWTGAVYVWYTNRFTMYRLQQVSTCYIYICQKTKIEIFWRGGQSHLISNEYNKFIY